MSPWMQTYSGKKFTPLDPDIIAIDIGDIAAHLSNICRFGGATRRFYSVAQHSVLVSELLPPETRLEGLLHDAAEAYVGDMISPLKQCAWFERSDGVFLTFREVEYEIQRQIARRFHLVWPWPNEVLFADKIMLLTEMRDLMTSPPEPWTDDGVVCMPTDRIVIPTTPVEAEQRFLRAFSRLSRT